MITVVIFCVAEDLEKPKMESLDESVVSKHDIDDKYHNLPSYLQKYFTIENIKYLLQQIDQYLTQNGKLTEL